MAVALIGAPGSGKSSVGAPRALLLDVPFVDVAAELARLHDDVELLELAHVAQWTARRLEGVGDAVVAYPSSVTDRMGADRVIYLKASAGQTFARSGLNVPAPVGALRPRALWMALLATRDPLYQEAADITLEVGEKSVAELAEEAAALLR